MEELELLNKIKKQLLEKGDMFVSKQTGNYQLFISPEDWHEIFKTEEYNKTKKS
jgi:hypothetical protein